MTWNLDIPCHFYISIGNLDNFAKCVKHFLFIFKVIEFQQFIHRLLATITCSGNSSIGRAFINTLYHVILPPVIVLALTATQIVYAYKFRSLLRPSILQSPDPKVLQNRTAEVHYV